MMYQIGKINFNGISLLCMRTIICFYCVSTVKNKSNRLNIETSKLCQVHANIYKIKNNRISINKTTKVIGYCQYSSFHLIYCLLVKSYTLWLAVTFVMYLFPWFLLCHRISSRQNPKAHRCLLFQCHRHHPILMVSFARNNH